MNYNDYIPPETIRAKCAEKCGDPDFKRHSRGWYMQSIRDALDKLAFDTFFDKGRSDDLTLPTSLILPLPRNTYSVKNIYVFNGECHPEDSVNVYWKMGFNNRPDGQSYTAPRNENNQWSRDPFMPGMFGSLSGLFDESFSTESALRFDYRTSFSAPTFPISTITIEKNSQTINSGYLTDGTAVDLWFESLGWTKIGTYSYKADASPDVYATPFTISSLGVDTSVSITYTSYTNSVGTTSVEDGSPLGVKWANIVQTDEGLILMLSQSCAGFEKVRVEYTGTFGTFEEVPCIPRIIRDAVEDFVCMEHGQWLIAMSEDNGMYKLYSHKFENPITGTLYMASDRVNSMSEWERKSLGIYLSRGNY